MENSDQQPYGERFEDECPECGTSNVTDQRTFGDDFPKNLCLECDFEYFWTDRNDVKTQDA